MRNIWVEHAEYFYASDIELPTKKLHQLLRINENTPSFIAGYPIVRIVDGKPVVFVTGLAVVNSTGVLSLYRVDLDRHISRLVETGASDTADFVVGPDGAALAQTLYDDPSGKWTLKFKTTRGWREAATRDEPIDPPSVLGLGRDGRSVLVAGSEKDKFEWRELSLDTAELGSLIPSFDGQAAIHDPVSGRLIGTHALIGDENRYTFFDPADARAWKAVESAFPGDRVSLVSWSNDRGKFLVRVDSAAAGPAYAIVDFATRQASWLGAEFEGLQPEDISAVTPVHYKAADGFDLSGYLTLPRGRDPKNLPLVVFPHGGPASRDEPGFDWWAQAMASRGYAVLQVNYRGSSGFGWSHMKAGFGEWGRKMQTDLSDGVRYLAGQGTIDPKRVCIVGASYGGYAALAGATLDPGVYRCAVSFGGVSDLKRLVLRSKDREGRSALRFWTRFMGAENQGDPVLAKYSPALQADKASAPILLIHGKDDSVVAVEQSLEMADALKRAGKPVELVVQNNADHWLSLGPTRLEMLKSTIAFLEKNNPPN